MYTPADFRSETPPKRIIGTEMEYYVLPSERRELQEDEFIRCLAHQGIIAVDEGYASNGARIYPDEDNIEYASPEAAGPKHAAEADFGGIPVVRKLAQSLSEEWDVPLGFPILRSAGTYFPGNRSINGRGYHENYLMPEPRNAVELKLLKDVFGSFLATRSIWDGAGLVTNEGFLLSQKAPDVGAEVKDNTGNATGDGNKPLASILTPSVGAGDKLTGRWALAEVRSGDSHMSRTQTYMKFAVTSLVLRLIEQEVINADNAADYTFRKPNEKIFIANHHFGQKRIALKSEDMVNSQQHQLRFAEAIMDMAQMIELPEDERIAAERFLGLCQKLGKLTIPDDIKPLVPDVGWATKLHAMRLKYGEDVLKSHFTEAVAFDLQWHSIDDRSPGLRTYDRFDPWHVGLANGEISSLGLPNTRAAARAQTIGRGDCVLANWNFVTIDGMKPVVLYDYWDPALPELETVTQPSVA